MSKFDTAKACCEALLQADSEADVIEILKAAGYWDDPAVWRYYGDKPKNWATVGNQQSRPEHALIEKLTNAIDTKLMAAAKIQHVPTEGPNAPQSITTARDDLFGSQLEKDMEGLSKSITVAATGARKRPSITIVDDGEGQTPAAMPRTILSLHEGNKENIPFVQGKFNMGGSGVLEFCGVDHNVELIISRRNPALLPPDASAEDRSWSFTVIRRQDPDPLSPRSSYFTYLAPGPADGHGKRGLLTFDAETMPIFPEKNRAYARQAQWGTLFKMYEYGTRAVTNMMLSDGLMMRIRILLPEPALPIRFHECRAGFSGDPNRSFDTPMAGIIYTLEEDRKNPKRHNVEWFDKFDIDIDGEKFAVRIYLFRKPEKGKNPADNYRKDEGVLFTYNGQCQHLISKDFFKRRTVRQEYLSNSLLVFVDCSSISVRAHEKLFMPNRESSRQSSLKLELERELIERIRDHTELEQMAIARRKAELSDNPQTSETFEKFLEEMVKKHPLLEKVLGPGFRIANPFKPHLVESKEEEWKGLRFPTKFHFRDQNPGETLSREAHLETDVRIAFETNAENDYFRRDEQPGTFELYEVRDDVLIPAKNWRSPNLFNGVATLKMRLPAESEVGSVAVYEAQITDPSKLEPFKNRFGLVVRAAREEHPSRPSPPKPPKVPGDNGGDTVSDDTRLAVPNPHEVWERDWGNQDPAFDKFTAMRIKLPTGADDTSAVYDYSINMNNIWLDQAIKESPRRAKEFRDKYKFGMTLLSLALVRHDVDLKKRKAQNRKDDGDEAENDQEAVHQDVRDVVREVTSAIAPFLLPLVDTLSQITGATELLSAVAGEAA